MKKIIITSLLAMAISISAAGCVTEDDGTSLDFTGTGETSYSQTSETEDPQSVEASAPDTSDTETSAASLPETSATTDKKGSKKDPDTLYQTAGETIFTFRFDDPALEDVTVELKPVEIKNETDDCYMGEFIFSTCGKSTVHLATGYAGNFGEYLSKDIDEQFQTTVTEISGEKYGVIVFNAHDNANFTDIYTFYLIDSRQNIVSFSRGTELDGIVTLRGDEIYNNGQPQYRIDLEEKDLKKIA